MATQVLDENQKCEALVLFANDKKNILSKGLSSDLKKAIKTPLENDFQGRFKETLLLYPPESSQIKRILIVGVGALKDVSDYQLRAASASAVVALKAKKLVKGICFAIPSIAKLKTEKVAEAMEGGIELSQFSLPEYKTDKEENKKLKTKLEYSFVVDSKKEVRPADTGKSRGRVIASAVNWSRRIIMMPPIDIYPDSLVDEVKKMVNASPSKSKIKATYLTEKDLVKLKYGGILGVGQGSERRPRMIILEYRGAAASKKPIALVGKGVTFDSGGLSLKPPPAQETMKYDMAGAATVLGAFKALTDMKVKANLNILVPTVENMVSGASIKPGDVLHMGSGKTVEVLNTDAEGRLILADAIFHATEKMKIKSCVDVATLTGACALLVGSAAAGLFGNDESLKKSLLKSGDTVGENLFPLPDYDNFYGKMLNSDLADLKNIGAREAGASTAAIFLRNFVHKDIPWAHLDIAGCGWYESPKDFIATRGPSGVPIRTLIEYVETSK